MAEKIICPRCRYNGMADEEKTSKKRVVVQICPRCGNPIRRYYKTKRKGKQEERKA